MAAGAGVQLYDQMRNNDGTVKPVKKWLYGTFKNEYCTFDEDGFIESLTFYYDVELDYNFVVPASRRHASPISFSLAWYMLPLDAEFAFHIYMSHIKEIRLRDLSVPIKPTIALNARFLLMPYVLSIEFGDTVVTNRLEPYVMAAAEGKQFDNNQFGYFFHFGEDWPRGQLSSLLMCASVMAAGDWQRAFANAHERSRFHAPTVLDVDYPNIGVSRAFNVEASQSLVVSFYLCDGAVGLKTQFSVTNIPIGIQKAIRVKRNGVPYDDFTIDNDGGIVIRHCMDVEEVEFEVFTGYTGDPDSKHFEPVTLSNSKYAAKI